MTMRPRSALLLSGLTLLACSPGFESPSRLRTLRVLAVQKDEPYAKPGDTVNLRMLLDDAGHPEPRGVKVTWFSGCENPPGDLYVGCFATLAGGDAGISKMPFAIGEGLEFSFRVSPDIISSRPRPADPKQPPYGIAYVFFAACPGTIRIVPPQDPTQIETLPIQCYSSDGTALGADDFVLGYTQVQAYDAFTNSNPIVTGFSLDDQSLTPECIGAECLPLEARELGLPVVGVDGGASDATARDAGVAVDAGPSGGTDPCDAGGPACLALCTKDQQSDCPEHAIRVEVDKASAEHDTVQEARDGTTLLEQMWIDYYVDAGRLDGDVKLLNDATLGWNDSHGTKLLTPKESGPFHIWAAVHDNRGGAQWIRVKLSTR